MILVDAGPLVAILHADDQHHEACREAFRAIEEPLGTVWPAFTEACYLLGFSWRGQDALWDLVARGVVVLLPLDERDVPRMQELMEQYQDLPMDLADAALVTVAEREHVSRIFTVDRADFLVYRPKGIGTFDVIPAR